jgi:hypothetical protein
MCLSIRTAWKSVSAASMAVLLSIKLNSLPQVLWVFSDVDNSK